MKYRLFLLCLVLTGFISAKSQQFLTRHFNLTSKPGTAPNTLIYLPPNYSPNKSYPVVIYCHSLSQAGTDLQKLYTTGLPHVLKNGYKPSFDFIMLAPQSARYSISPEQVQTDLDDVQKEWKIDSNRIYLTGIDAGGWAAYGSQNATVTKLQKKIAAIVTVSAATQQVEQPALKQWAQDGPPLWAIAGAQDKWYASQTEQLVNTLNSVTPGLAHFTQLPAVAHDGWNQVYNGSVMLDGKTIWNWLYQFDRTKTFSKVHALVSTKDSIAANAVTSTTTGKQVQVNIYSGSNAYSNTAWNNWNVGSGNGYTLTSNAFNYSDGTTSSLKAVLSQSLAVADNSSTYGSGMAPAAVLRYTSYSTSSRTLTLTGLSTSKTYSIDLYASRVTNSGNNTVFTVNGTSRSIATYNNLINKATFSNIAATTGGQIKISINSSNIYNYINGFTITESSSALLTDYSVNNTTIQLGTKVEAEQYTDRSGILLQTTRDFAGGGLNTFDAAYGDWISYAVRAPTAGYYTVCFRLACDVSGSKFEIRNGSTLLSTVSVPNTNGWQTWRDVTAAIYLQSGTQTLKLRTASSTGWNLNYFEFVKTPGNAFASYTLRQNSGLSIYLPEGLNLKNLKPGDTLNIRGGIYNVIDLGNFRGDATHPIIIRNKAGQVYCKIIRFSNKPEYFSLLGNGTSGINYGFKIDGLNETGSCLTAFGTDFEIGYVEATHSKSGFFIKKNPASGDPESQFPNYEMRNVRIHHNYIHHITGEGMYIGHTGPDGGQGGNPLLPVRMRNVTIAYNKVDQTGWDGIQLSNATTGNKIHHNTVTNFGTSNVYGQQAGILLGGNSQADIYDNTVKYGTGNGIQNFGFGLNKIYNNYLTRVGRNGTDRGYEGVYCNDIIITSEKRPKQQIEATNNSILYPMPWGAIRVSGYNNNSLPATMEYNKLLLTTVPSDWQKLYFPTYVANSIISGNTLLSQ